jgi:hypothetical protein
MTVELHIDEIVLVGLPLPAGAEPRFRRAAEREIARSLARDGLAARHRLAGAVPTLRAPGITTAAAPDTAVLASQVARAVARGLSR